MLSEKYKNILIISSIIMAIIIIGLTGYIVVNRIKLSKNMKEAETFTAEFSNLINEKEAEVKYKESDVVGIIEIPIINLKTPILIKTQTNLKETCGILTGAGINQAGNTVIAGQSYYKNTAFHGIEKIKLEDEIYVTDISGIQKTCSVNNIYKTNIEDKKYITENTKGNTRITLITNIEGEILVVQANVK